MHMYMYKTSVSWSVWEGDYLGVSTFLTGYIKCTQGWIFYLFGFFFRTTPCGALDIWTCKITTSFTNMQVTKHSGFQKAPSCSAPSSSRASPPHPSPLVPKSTELSPKHPDPPGPGGWAHGGFSCHPSYPPYISCCPLQEIFMPEFSRLELMLSLECLLCTKPMLKHSWAWIVQKDLTKHLNYVSFLERICLARNMTILMKLLLGKNSHLSLCSPE